MAAWRTIRLDSYDDGVRVITLADPERRNALGERMRDELAAAVQRVRDDSAARALVVGAEGTAFCAGADLPAMFGDAGERPVGELRATLRAYYDAFLAVLALPIPTIAAVQGPAVGAGLNLALCCDIRIAGPGARFAATFTKIGLHPGGGCTWFLTRELGPQRALALMLEGGALSAERALSERVVLSVEPDPLATALGLARSYAALRPALVRDLKRSVRLAAGGADLDAVVEFEAWAQAESATHDEVREFAAKFAR
ncbi:enoyl-CoA hydratase [Thermocatellispora tengchongensis]|uniref:Enoyl-CoA hydratase n=1 Tax=Thermocatellispora tengchongensis TaxID=1073253 RepID=A0A840NYY5_9ACTN|nr:enoyl-CoA hydratase [Thermocatellispora tengchongensis]MBB5132372.1 enoyl-CoA hydratase [Thermocatellispora tengchongensis]